MKRLILAGIALALFMPVAPQPVHAATCAQIKAEYRKKLRPRMSRIARQNLRRSNWYYTTLKKKQAGAPHPTPAIIRATRAAMVASCGSNGGCKKLAGRLTAVSLDFYKLGKRWSKAGCKGKLDS